MAKFKFYVGNAFADPKRTDLSGNPAAVVILENDSDIDDKIKQSIGTQFNLSETVFVSKQPNEDEFLIRWFTPEKEAELCGHATLVTSHILLTEQHCYTKFIQEIKLDNGDQQLKFKSKWGTKIQVTLDNNNDNIIMSFPSYVPVSVESEKWCDKLVQALIGANKRDWINDIRLADNGYILLQLKDGYNIKEIMPNYNLCKTLELDKPVCLAIITQRANYDVEGVHFYARVFAPWYGVVEDPVCGSAFTLTSPYWNEKLQDSNSEWFIAKQMSKRGGIVYTRVEDDRTLIGGQVQLFCEGHFTLQ